MKKDVKSNKCAFTFLELIVAISIAAIVVVLVFTFMRSTLRGIRMQDNRVEIVEDMIIAKKRMESVVDRIEYVVNVNKEGVEFKEIDSDTIHRLIFKNEALIVDNDTICKKIKNVDFQYDEQNVKKKVLYWEGEIGKRYWIGGARCFKSNGSTSSP